jgi:D-serine dehydratase
MRKLLALLLLSTTAHAGQHEQLPIDEVYIMVCHNADGMFFVRPSGIVYALQGMNGAPNCVAVLDTAGKDHMLCRDKKSTDICELAEPGPEV